MDAQELKENLILNNEDAIKILDSIGCHGFKKYSKEIRCAPPERNNSSALVIKRNTMGGVIYLSDNEVVRGDFYSIVMHLKRCSFIEALKYCNSVLGHETSYFYKKKVEKENPFWLHRKIKRKRKSIDFNTCPIDDAFLEQYIRLPHIDFIKDGIIAKVQEKYGICFDDRDSRIVIPHYKWDTGEIIGLFGRTTIADFEKQNIPKYFGIRPYPKNMNLFGLWQNYEQIQKQGYVIVGEAEKFPMQLDTYGEKTGVAVCCHEISPMQRKILIGLDVEVVIAFDKGISLEHIKKTVNGIKKYRKCTYIYDELGLLPDTASPIDMGKDIFDILFANRK